MKVKIGYFKDICNALGANVKTLRALKETYAEQIEHLKSDPHFTAKVSDLYDAQRKVVELECSFEEVGEEVMSLITDLVKWDLSVPKPDVFDRQKYATYCENKRKHFETRMSEYINQEDEPRVKAGLQSMIGVVEATVKAGLISAPAGMASARTFLASMDAPEAKAGFGLFKTQKSQSQASTNNEIKETPSHSPVG